MADLEDLIVPEDADTVEATIYAAAEANDLPTTQWQAFSWARTLIHIFALVMADVWFGVAQIANGVILGLSRGRWLTLFASSQYDEERLAAVATVGQVTLTSASVGHTIAVGDVTVKTATGKRFRNTTGGTLTAGGTLDLEVQAYEAGASSNVSVGTITIMETSLSTVTVNNPEVGTTGTWITTWGANAETDAELTTRLPLKWATLSTGSPPDAYKSWALAIPGVTRAKLNDAAPDGPGTTRLYIDNAGLVATVQADIDTRVPAGSSCTVSAATTESVPVTGVVSVRRAYRDAAEAAINDALTEYELEVEIGGIVRKAEVIERVMAPTGVVDYAIGSEWTGSPNITLGTTAIPVFAVSLTYVEV